MQTPDFAALCDGISELTGLAAPPLAPDAKGTLAYRLTLQGVAVTFAETQRHRGTTLCLVAELGGLAERDAWDGWLALMDHNMLLAGLDAPHFSCNPQSGSVILQWAFPLAGATAGDVHRRACGMAEIGMRWRKDPLLSHPPQAIPQASAMATQHPAGASADRLKFRKLHQELCEAAGSPAPAPGAEGSEVSFPIRMGDVDVVLVHSEQFKPGSVFLAIAFGKPAPVHGVLELEALMTANFMMLGDQGATRFCRHPLSGELMLRSEFPLEGQSGSQCLARLSHLAASAQEWKQSSAEATRQTAEALRTPSALA